MKKQLAIFASIALLGLVANSGDASVVVSNLDPANDTNTRYGQEIGEALLTGNRPISLTSVQFSQTDGPGGSETFSVYSRNTDGTVGSSLFTDFSLSYDGNLKVATARTNSAFTLQANSGYFFVLDNYRSAIEWDTTPSTDYAAAFGASLPATNTSYGGVTGGMGATYFSLASGPQLIQVNGTALPAVPEPSAWAFSGLALAGVVFAVRRRTMVV